MSNNINNSSEQTANSENSTLLGQKLGSSVQHDFLTGVLVLAPFGAVLWVVIWIWNFLTGLLTVLPDNIRPTVLFNIHNPIAIQALEGATTLVLVGLICIFVWVVGITSRNLLGKRIIATLQYWLRRIPVLRTVYSSLEQLTATFATNAGSSKNFRRVVQIEYPRKGIYSLALVTGEKSGMLRVFIPTTPNPTSGFYLFIPSEDAKSVDLTVEDAIKEIISMGIIQKG